MKNIQLKLIAAAVCLALMFSLLWLWTAQQSWKGVILERGFEQGQDFSPEALLEAWEANRDIAGTVLPGRHVHYCGLASQLIAAEQNIESRTRAIALVDGMDCIRKALTREPADAHAWARLAWFEYYYLNGPSPEVLKPLRMSMYCQPAGRSLVFWRVRMSGMNQEFWDPDFESLLRRQIVLAWRLSRERLARVAVETEMKAFVRKTLSGYPEDLQRFEDLTGAVSR